MPHQAAPPFLFPLQFEGTAHYLVGSGKLLVAGNLLNGLPLFNLKDDEVTHQVEEVTPVEGAIDRALHPVILGYVVMGRRVAPLMPGMKLCSRHTVSENKFVNCATEGVGIIELRGLAAIAGALPRPFGPVGTPVSSSGLGLNVNYRNAVEKKEQVGTDVVFRPFQAELIGDKKIICVNVVVVHEPDGFFHLIHGKLHRFLAPEPPQPFAIIPLCLEARQDVRRIPFAKSKPHNLPSVRGARPRSEP